MLALSALSELDPANRGAFAERLAGYRLRDEEAEQDARDAKFGKALANMGMGDLAGLSPQQMSALYGFKRDGIDDERYAQEYGDRRGDRAEDIRYRNDRADASDDQWLAGHNQGVREADRAHDRWQMGRDRDIYESDRTYALQREKFDRESSIAAGWRQATAQEIAGYGHNPETTTAQIGPKGEFKVVREQKPLISSENMARVASNLPNLMEASDNLNELFTTKQGGGLTGGLALEKGYRPGHDWGARMISAVPDWGALEGLAKFVGGKDYQTYETEYAAFEAAALPIVSGSAVSESEGRRFLNSIKIQVGDNDAIVERKLRAKQNFVLGLEAAVNGDATMLRQLIDGNYNSVPTPAPADLVPPDAAVARLRAEPHLAKAFDAKYGDGASARYLGG
ncbi:MAG: hypothetical protein AAF194_08835 [Pseudomonadota bacterium]